jgi:hypothetical protein
VARRFLRSIQINTHTMFAYPLTFKNESEHKKHVMENKEWYLQVVTKQDATLAAQCKPQSHALVQMKQETEELHEQIQEHARELKQTQAVHARLQEQLQEKKKEVDRASHALQTHISSHKTLSTAIERVQSATPSSHRGISLEVMLEAEIRRLVSRDSTYAVERNARGIDIVVTKNNVRVGVECKNKSNVTKADMDKLIKDAATNTMDHIILMSSRSHVPAHKATGSPRFEAHSGFHVTRNTNIIVACTDNVQAVAAIAVFLASAEKIDIKSQKNSLAFIFSTISTAVASMTQAERAIKTTKDTLQKSLEKLTILNKK